MLDGVGRLITELEIIFNKELELDRGRIYYKKREFDSLNLNILSLWTFSLIRTLLWSSKSQ